MLIDQIVDCFFVLLLLSNILLNKLLSIIVNKEIKVKMIVS